jgi:hypothetical protein
MFRVQQTHPIPRLAFDTGHNVAASAWRELPQMALDPKGGPAL